MSSIIPLPQKSDNSLSTFQFDDNSIRVVTDANGEPLFVATDVCKTLAIINSRDALNRLDADEKGVVITDTPGGSQQLAVVNESGLYSLILTSRKPEAKAFKRWITHEVLPSIRQTGQYQTNTVMTSEALLVAVQHLVDLERAQRELQIAQQRNEHRMSRIEARQDVNEQNDQYWPIVGYATWIGRHIDDVTAISLGKKATRLSKLRNIHIGKAKHKMRGYVNTYHESILKDVFDNWYSQFPLLED